MTDPTKLAPLTFALLQDIARAVYGEYALNIPGNDDELKELWGHGLIDVAPTQEAPYNFTLSEKFDLFFEVKDPESYSREPRFSNRFIIVAR